MKTTFFSTVEKLHMRTNVLIKLTPSFKMWRFAILITCLFTLTTCSLFQNKNLARRYRNLWNVNTFGNSPQPLLFVQVDLQSILLKEEQPKDVKFNLLSLTDKGQEAYITAANSKAGTPQQLSDIINTNFTFSKDEKSNVKIIPKTIKKTLIFTVDRLQVHHDTTTGMTTFNTLGDRISFLELRLAIPPVTGNVNQAIFNSWDKYVTDKITLNLGKVSSAQNWNASLSLNAKGTTEASLVGSNVTEDFASDKGTGSTTFVNTGTGNSNTNANGYELLSTDKGTNSKTNSAKVVGELGGSATVGYTDKYETSLDLNSQILKLSGSLKERQIILRQESGPGIDLSGNIVVSVEYALADDWAAPVKFNKIKNLYGSTGAPNSVALINNSFLTVFFPNITANITGRLDYSFLYRQVNKGNRHLPEARQKVKYRYGNVNFNQNTLIRNTVVDLVKTQDIRPKSYILRLNGTTNTLELNGVAMAFETVSDASTFLVYVDALVQNGIALTGLTLGGAALTNANVPNLKVVTLQL